MKWLAGSLLLIGASLMFSSWVTWRVAHMCDNCEPRFNAFMTVLLVAGAVLFLCGCAVLVHVRKR